MKHKNKYFRMEAEANQFAALLLMPPPKLRTFMKPFRRPDINHIQKISDHFGVSYEAAGITYIKYHGESMALVIAQGDKILRFYRENDFPYITAGFGDKIPEGSNFYYPQYHSEMQECMQDAWCDRSGISINEQVYQRGGYSMVLLWAEIRDFDEAYYG